MFDLSDETRKRINRALKDRRVRAACFAAAAVLFAYGLYRAIDRRPDLLDNLQWLPIAGTLMLVPVTLLLMTIRFMVSCRAIGSQITLRSSWKVVILGSAANILPIPGGIMVRVAAMSRGGASLGKSIGINLDLTVCWLGVAALYSAVAAAAVGNSPLGMVFLCIGAGSVGLSMWLLIRRTGRGAMSVTLAGIQTIATLVDIVRVWLCFQALGLTEHLVKVMGLSISSVAGSIVTVIPAGLGVREWVAALLAPVFQLAPEAAYLGSTLNRIAVLAVVLVMTVIVFLIEWRDSKDKSQHAV